MTCLRKFNYFFNDESEENWINEMSAKGWHFKQFRLGMYAFEKGEPGEYIYRVDYLDKLGFGKAVKEYIDFVESTGPELVQKQLNWVYFRQHRDLGEFELYSDSASKLQFINRLLAFIVAIIFVNLLSIVANGSISFTGDGHSIHSFFAGFSSGVIMMLLIPTISLVKRRKKLKKKSELFEV